MVKQATKGQKEIYEENRKTILQYAAATAISLTIYSFAWVFLFDSNTTSGLIGLLLTISIQTFALLFMKSLSKAKFDQKGHILDSGADLNDPEAFGEYCKDAIILTVIVQLIALYTNYAYLILLVFPAILGYKFVVGLFLPWITAGSEDTGNEAENDRKLRKREKIQYRSR
ncbi:unnamed protein product [Caenorhabditis angaria]|uniref:Transmembrane protein 208 n=1 Tax=Caenorhabditis angaria TaxID=860376 RepID=A0A9P1I6J3_9PELO|nr:unnamed protein product [Caenorhabditis angaria]